MSKIEWTDETFNPWWGCVEVSIECDNCYARVWARRTGEAIWGKHSPRRPASEGYWQRPFREYRRKAEKLGRPLRVFCASMADVFETHPQLPPLRGRLWDVIEQTPWIDWQLLTKRPRSVQLMAPWGDDWPANVWIGTSIGVPEHSWRADVLRQIPAAVRFISAEPLLSGLFAGKRPLSLDGIDWLIIGGESGPKARPLNVADVDALIAKTREFETAVFVKQLGSVWASDVRKRWALEADAKGGDWTCWPERLRIREFPPSRVRSEAAA